MDVVLDFNGQGGKKFILWNDAPAPYPMGDHLNDFPDAGLHGDTGNILRFEVADEDPAIPADPPLRITPLKPLAGNPNSGIDPPLAGIHPKAPASSLSWNTATTAPLPVPTRAGVRVRQLTLNETFDEHGRLIQMQGTNLALALNSDGTAAFARPYSE